MLDLISNEILDKYYKNHKACPNCGSISHTSTLTGYILDWTKPNAYKDLNKCECLDCGSNHITHDRVPFVLKYIEFIWNGSFVGTEYSLVINGRWINLPVGIYALDAKKQALEILAKHYGLDYIEDQVVFKFGGCL